MPAPHGYDRQVFLNCPFDDAYQPIFRGLVFAVYDAGLMPRCALEVSDSSQVRIDKIMALIAACRFGIHDLSRAELDAATHLPRFNMPLELGIFLGCKRFGTGHHRRKPCLVLYTEPYRYRQFMSDIAGQDPLPHRDDSETAVRRVRDWLRSETRRANIPGADAVVRRFRAFQGELPAICGQFRYQPQQLTFADLTHVVLEWLKKNPL